MNAMPADGAVPLARWWLPVFALFTLHNLEEIVFDLPRWGRDHGFDIATTRLDQAGFAVLITVLSAMLFALAFILRCNDKLTRLYLAGFLALMALNFVWHMAGSFVTGSVQPGVMTAVPLLPACIWLAWKLVPGFRRVDG
ncbi:MAG: HXXEE domain-containing protein [Alphaproteobacteria bacterium]|nr:HXXEE domain-containing protein [Alphaproteobacteria bacterium]